MNHPSAFLSGDPDHVGERLLQVARRERAPHGARERALSRVAAVSVGAAATTTAKAALAAPAATAGGGILAAKWLVIGLSGALVGLTALDQAQRALAPAAATAVAPVVVAPAREMPGVVAAPSAPRLTAPAVAVPSFSAVSHAAPSVVIAPQSPAPELAATPDTPVANPSAAAFEPPRSAQLAREVAALRQARALLAQGRPGHALETLTQYHREFPVGMLGTEEAALRVELAFAMGDRNAPELAQRFVAQYPGSPLATRVRALLDAKSSNGVKP